MRASVVVESVGPIAVESFELKQPQDIARLVATIHGKQILEQDVIGVCSDGHYQSYTLRLDGGLVLVVNT